MADFLQAREIARNSRLDDPLAATLNNLASLYLQMNDPEAAAQTAREALAGPVQKAEKGVGPKVRVQLAEALVRLHHFDEARSMFFEAVDELEEQGDLESSARVLANLGNVSLEAGRVEDAETALDRAMLLVRVHNLPASPNMLRGLGRLESRKGDWKAAATLFQEALDTPSGLTPKWSIYADRGKFRLTRGDLEGALADFREARKNAAQLRADIVPADQDRIALESGLGSIAEGIVTAGNLLGRKTSDQDYLQETFDVAEQDRLWSLRALVPTPNDWRTRLPANYWDLLARYQASERKLASKPGPEVEKTAAALQLQLREIESQAASGDPAARITSAEDSAPESPLDHVQATLDSDSVLLSFHIAKSSGWVWAIDRNGVNIYSVPTLDSLKPRVDEFAAAARQGDEKAIPLGRQLYRDLFGTISPVFLSHKRWLLELDGPLYDLPFAALVAGEGGPRGKDEPIYLIEKAALQVIPGALMLDRRTPIGDGGFLGIGDPIYNAADDRYHGHKGRSEVVLPRLSQTSSELEACARTLGASKTRILTGDEAGIASVRSALTSSNASVIHFATHVIASSDLYSSNLIALSLDRSGAMGLLGPTEIAAHPVSAGLVVLNGCHSGEGNSLPGTGLMGLTRAWLGAGARSVVATRWDIPDEVGKTMMVEFYRALRAHPEGGSAMALQQAELSLLKSENAGNDRNIWAAYFLLGRE